MNPVEDKEGMPQEGITLSSAEKRESFATIMKRLKGRSAEERAALTTQADETVLGYEAYALGQEYLERGDFGAAGRWLRVAAGHSIPGAEQALEEMAMRQTSLNVVGLTAAGTAVRVEAAPPEALPSSSGVCITNRVHPGKNDEPWGAVLDNLNAA
ncbi:hypothetical protein [Streptomyces europaeiscabiei]|uniref:hypothetical protein n=1 Tax=Streptomyces europaeiscabiei TaxID=146819 RepID=UPI002E118EDC|nr:hypothetical protein OHB30_00055 [Streptomyces europaeiscabiei]WSG28418.1 hypothetical protein OHB30_50275 [Streptomyces europaeiscabiei]